MDEYPAEKCPHGVWDYEDGCYECQIESQKRHVSDLQADLARRIRRISALEAALREIRDHSQCMTYASSHRCAAEIARKCLEGK